MKPLKIRGKTLEEFLEATAKHWRLDLEIIDRELKEGRRVDQFIKNRKEMITLGYMKQFWKDIVQTIK